MLYRISVTERGLTGIANIFRSRLSRLDDLLGAGTVPLSRSATKLRTAPQILILQDNAALQSNYNVFYVHRYAFYDQFAIK